jgi:hypothetical protein
MDINPSITDEKQKKLKRFHLINFISCGSQLIIIITIIYYFFNLDWMSEIKGNIKIAFPEDGKDEQVKNLTIYSLKYGQNISFFLALGLIIWKFFYNFKFLNFFDENVTWINNTSFYIFYSMSTPVFCSIITDQNYSFYNYFVYAEIYASFIMVGAFLLSAIVFTFSCLVEMMGSTREVGRHWEGNTQVISMAYNNDGVDLGCGCGYIKKIMRGGYFLLSLYGFIMLGLLIVGMNIYFIKVFVGVELIINIVVFWSIKSFQKFLYKNKNNLREVFTS